MKLTAPPELPWYLQETFTHSTPIQQAIIERIEALEAKKTPADLSKFNRQKQAFIAAMAENRLGTAELQRLYIKAMEETRQVISRPEITDLEFDTFAALDQPEILDALAAWTYPRGSRGFEANPTCSKALMTLMALGNATHVRSARKNLVAAHGLQMVFADIEEKAAAIAGRDPKPCRTNEYTVCLDQIRALSSTGFNRELLRANIEILKQLRAMFPKAGIAELAAIDGTDVAAWVAQVGVAKTAEEEEWIRRRTPHAGARFIERDNEVSINGETGEILTSTTGSKFWRGYYLVVLVCIKTGLPLVWTLRDANSMSEITKEADSIRDLLELLFELWPDCPLRVVTGDKAWDFEEYHRFCLTRFGIHLAIIQRDDNEAKKRPVDQVDHKHVVEYTGRGEVYCRHHHDKSKYGPMTLVGFEFAPRDGLKPGEVADLSKFRVRHRCDHCAKTYSLPIRGTGKHTDWNFFTYYPHAPLHARRYAQRRALESRRNVIESVFAGLKTVCQLALRGPDRTRLTDFDTVDTLIALSFTLRNSQAIAAERIRRGEYSDSFPTGLLGARQMLAA